MVVFTMHKDGLHHSSMYTSTEDLYRAIENSYGQAEANKACPWICHYCNDVARYRGKGFTIELEDIDL